MNLKFGVIYAKSGQITDDEFFSNETGSETFDRFLDLLGDKVTLKGWTGYKGGLDTKNNMTGETSIFTEFEEHQLMFHVSTLLPFSKEDSQQVRRQQEPILQRNRSAPRQLMLAFCNIYFIYSRLTENDTLGTTSSISYLWKELPKMLQKSSPN